MEFLERKRIKGKWMERRRSKKKKREKKNDEKEGE
jgi:hypothetical protein